ncbi:MAG: metallophosphoesterase [Clostridia bacterium]|nr:metallophosphoesterase [Clostridia bacterium]
MYIAIIIIVLLSIFLYINYKVIFVTKYKIESEKLPESFNNFKILHLSDWHCTQYGKNNRKLINLINKQDVDIIVMTGDFIIRQVKDYKPAIEFIKQLNCKKKYFIYGNHELELNWKRLWQFRTELEALGVIVLDNEKTYIERNEEKIYIHGLTYNFNHLQSRKELTNDVVEKNKRNHLVDLGTVDTNNFNILLAHDPLNFEAYSRLGYDLIYSGHLHGGGIRLFGFGLVAPRRFWVFTRLAAGTHKRRESQIIISRGVGNSTKPIRIFNPPEISITTLKRK